ncbi:MAG TPA: V-type ATPase 116kDa subunit family protein [Bacteroidales bacterium]|nr:V-type ATPase 116kDa subunit family protein [Bacteroidales bacterium]
MVFHRDYHDFLIQLGQLGVLHVIERESPEREASLAGINVRIGRINECYSIIAGARAQVEPGQAETKRQDGDNTGIDHILDEIERYRDRRESIAASIEERKVLIEKQEPWGDYNEQDLHQLEKSDYQAFLYRSSLHNFQTIREEDFFIFKIHRTAASVWFMLVAPAGCQVDIDAEREMPARYSLTELREQQHSQEQELQMIMKSLALMDTAHREKLVKEKRRLESDLALREVYFDTLSASDDSLRILEGWVPAEHLEKVKTLAEKVGAVTIETTPDEEEMPPVQLRNSPFTRLFEPITTLFDLPKYSELDLTPYFAPFFMIFFGFCLGDAGYGVVFILLGALVKLRLNKDHRLRPVLTLGQYFGVATIVFGLLSGTFFGMNLVDSGYTLTADSFGHLEEKDVPTAVTAQLQPLEGSYFRTRKDFMVAVDEALGITAADYRKVVLRSAEAGFPVIRKFRHLMQEPLTMFYLSLLIGAIQIIFGIFVRILNIVHRKGFRYALSPVGWLLLITTMVLYFGTELFTSHVLMWVFYGLLVISGLFIFLLNKPGTGIFTRIGSGVWDSYSTITGVFGDLLSYIRLFALGISSAILGFVFNDISLQLLNIRWIGWLFFLVVLLAGHSMNILLATLGAFVHPMRLTFVEFYKNAGFEGGGKEYRPFRVEEESGG